MKDAVLKEEMLLLDSHIAKEKEMHKDLSAQKKVKQFQFRKDLDLLLQESSDQKLQSKIGITKDEIAINRRLVNSMLTQVQSDNKIEVLPIVGRK